MAASARWSLHRHHARATEAPADAAQAASATPMPEYGVRTTAAAVRPPPSTLHRRAEVRSRLSCRKYLVRSSTVVPSRPAAGDLAGSRGVAALLVHAGADLVEPRHGGRVGRRRLLPGGLGRRGTELLPRHAGPDLLQPGRPRHVQARFLDLEHPALDRVGGEL